MAILSFKSGATATTRRHGIVYATQQAIPTVRAGSVPVVPATNLQVSAGVALSTAAGVWANMTSAQQMAWTNFGYLGNTPYANFTAFQMRRLTQGFPVLTVPNWSIYGAGLLLIAAVCNASTGTYYLRVVYFGDTTPGLTWNAYLYVQASSVLPTLTSGSSGSTPGRPGPIPNVPPSGYNYYTALIGLTQGVYYDFPIGDLYLGLVGSIPTPVTYNASTNQNYGSYFDALAYMTDPNGLPLTQTNTGTSPPYPTYTAASVQAVGGAFVLSPPF
jgi:hypothetical protein